MLRSKIVRIQHGHPAPRSMGSAFLAFLQLPMRETQQGTLALWAQLVLMPVAVNPLRGTWISSEWREPSRRQT